jgi:hypothetical protein
MFAALSPAYAGRPETFVATTMSGRFRRAASQSPMIASASPPEFPAAQ